MRRNDFGRLWPTRAQQCLLKAALAQDAASAAAHVAAWLEEVDLETEHLDEGSFRVLPLLWANLTRLGVAHPQVARFKGVLRNSWVQSVRLTSIAAALLQEMAEAGIPTLVAKGFPLAQDYYEKRAYRPMNDLDIVVAPDDAAAASRLLHERGFEADRRSWREELALGHALVHRHPQLGEIDLHWHVLFDTPNREADSHFWDDAIPLDVEGAATLRPCGTDLLLHVLVHGMRWNMAPPMRWVADSAMILRSGETIAWERLIAFAVRHRLGKRVGMALAYLSEQFELPVPVPVLQSLGKKETFFERLELFAMRGADDHSAWRHLRRVTYIPRLLSSDNSGDLPRALAAEFSRRLRKPSPAGG